MTEIFGSVKVFGLSCSHRRREEKLINERSFALWKNAGNLEVGDEFLLEEVAR